MRRQLLGAHHPPPLQKHHHRHEPVGSVHILPIMSRPHTAPNRFFETLPRTLNGIEMAGIRPER
jgi:hypothetical protein